MEFYKGLVHLKQGRFDEAINRLHAAIGAGLGSREAHAHYFMADALWALGRFDAALACVDRALQSAYPDWFRGRMIRIRIGHFMGNVDEAKRELDGLWGEFGATHRASFRASSPASASPSSRARSCARTTPRGARTGSTCVPTASAVTTTSRARRDLSSGLDRAVENREWWMLHTLRSELSSRNPEPSALPARDAPACGDRSERLATKSVATGRQVRSSGRGNSGNCQAAERGCPMIPR